MHIRKDRYGEEIPCYDTREEEMAAIGDYLRGDYSRLTACEVEFFRACQDDPAGVKGDAEHAGELVDITELALNGVLFVYFPHNETLAQSRKRLEQLIGAHPLTPARIWQAVRNLSATPNR